MFLLFGKYGLFFLSYALVQSLGAVPVDYNDEVTAKEKLVKYGPFEVIMDCAESDLAEWSDNVLGIWRNCIHVSVISPLLHDADRFSILQTNFSVTTSVHF